MTTMMSGKTLDLSVVACARMIIYSTNEKTHISHPDLRCYLRYSNQKAIIIFRVRPLEHQIRSFEVVHLLRILLDPNLLRLYWMVYRFQFRLDQVFVEMMPSPKLFLHLLAQRDGRCWQLS